MRERDCVGEREREKGEKVIERERKKEKVIERETERKERK